LEVIQLLSSYYTVKGFGEHEIVIQKSRFIAHMDRATTEEEAQSFIERIKIQHWNASHNCSAYMIGEHDQTQKANDDGEPSGTAGVPILEVLKKRNLKDTVVVITRYFGGIKLGAGGLIRAYGSATSEGLNATGIVERKLMTNVSSEIEYTLLGKLENELRNHNSFLLKSIEYLENVKINTLISYKEVKIFEEWMTNLTNGSVNIKINDQEYIQEDL
jgi:uncharacterized YigZ family protein